MSRKQLTAREKYKYVKIAIEKGVEDSVITYLCDYDYRYQGWYAKNSKDRRSSNPARNAKAMILIWLNKYNVGNMKALESKTGKSKKPNSGRRKKVSINELDEHDRDLYQDIMEDILKDHGIKPSIIQEKIKERKRRNKKFHNHKRACNVLGINRTSTYSVYISRIKEKQRGIQRHWVDELLVDMCLVIVKSDYTIGRDKLFKTMINNGYNISSYVFRIHFESMDYKSRSYVRKGNKPPLENKYKSVWAEDFVQEKFISEYPGEVIHADIKYIKFKRKWWYLHVIIETYSNKVLAWSLSDKRTSYDSINLVSKAINKLGYSPRVFHSDHGIEYANYNFKKYLENKGVLQSMSRKGHSLGNRPSEFWFAQVQREKLDFYNILDWDYNDVYNLISSYVDWYNLERIQSNLQYKTPQDVFSSYGVCV